MNDPIEAPPTKPNDMYADYPAGPRITVESLNLQARRLAFFLTCSMSYYTYLFVAGLLGLGLSRFSTTAFVLFGMYVAIGVYALYRLWTLPRPALWLILLPWVLQLAIALRYQSEHSPIWAIPVVSGIATFILWRNWKTVEKMKATRITTNGSPMERVS